jgi:hypothetical protein
MTFKLKKLDKRYNGSNLFKFVAIPDHSKGIAFISGLVRRSQEQREFSEIRKWCWSQWGPSCELRLYRDDTEWTNPLWCWDSEHDNLRIYLQSDKEAAWFKLKW